MFVLKQVKELCVVTQRNWSFSQKTEQQMTGAVIFDLVWDCQNFQVKIINN